MENLYLPFGLLIGGLIAWLYAKQKLSTQINNLQNQLQHTNEKLVTASTILETTQDELKAIVQEKNNLDKSHLELQLTFNQKEETLESTQLTLKALQEEIQTKQIAYNELNNTLATTTANVMALTEKLATQKEEMEEVKVKFNKEFENIANRILEEKTEKFTTSNKLNMESLLKPLGENLDKFKSKVEEVYDKESKERFSLGEKVRELAELNQVISEEAKNLTRALKGESKTQGLWGEMILESILEKSGLVKGREYFMEHQLVDETGKAIKSESEGKKMRPDAVIKYPDDRSVIIDSKVSLTAFTRYLETTDAELQKIELAAHVSSIKSHIQNLSTKGYDDYNKALDFVMLFIPSEPAYIAAMQGDPNLWNFAYEKRILLLNPTNLITSLKLIVDLWKRENQNKNAFEIAERGGKLYDKFVGFIENMQAIGDNLNKAQSKYDDAFKQLSSGNDNLVLQATKLKKLGLKTKKNLTVEMEDNSGIDSETED
jgi:DNA recombination protein RmuC